MTRGLGRGVTPRVPSRKGREVDGKCPETPCSALKGVPGHGGEGSRKREQMGALHPPTPAPSARGNVLRAQPTPRAPWGGCPPAGRGTAGLRLHSASTRLGAPAGLEGTCGGHPATGGHGSSLPSPAWPRGSSWKAVPTQHWGPKGARWATTPQERDERPQGRCQKSRPQQREPPEVATLGCDWPRMRRPHPQPSGQCSFCSTSRGPRSARMFSMATHKRLHLGRWEMAPQTKNERGLASS